MASIEDKVVSLKFDGAGFAKGASNSQKALEKLNQALQMKGGGKGLDDVENRAKNLDLSKLSEAPKNAAKGFSILAGAAAVALGNIATQAINAGSAMASSFTMQPIMDGFREYETKMGSIQTILANTASKGTSLNQVTSALDSLNEYADKTIYNFAEMTHNIGLFTNAGLGVEVSASMIKGFSNAAAASGTTSTAAANAAYQLSQALSAGTIRLMDWRSLTNAGMGNKNMQEGLIQIAEAMGTFTANGTTASKAQEDFNGSLEKGWLTADVMSKYLQIMAGDIDAAAMAEMGLTESQIEAFQVQQKNAEEAATKVRTFSQLMGTLQETMGSGWAKTFEILLGDFDEASELFTNINNVISPAIDRLSDARNALLQGWKDLGGRKDVIDGLSAAFSTVSKIFGTVGKAFREVFPPTTAERLKALSERFKNFAQSLVPGEQTLTRLGNVAKTVFAALKVAGQIAVAVFKIAGSVIAGAVNVIGKAFGLIPFGKIADNLGDVATKMASWKGASELAASAAKNISSFFQSLGDKIETVRPKLDSIGSGIAEFFKRVKYGTNGAASGIGKFFKGISEAVRSMDIFSKVKGALQSFGKWLSSFDLAGLLKNAIFIGGSAGLFAGLIQFVRSLTGVSNKFKDAISSFGGIGEGVSSLLDGVRNSLKAYEQNLKAKALISIAGAIVVLAGALFILSKIPLDRVGPAMYAMAGSLAALVGGLTALDRLTKDPKKAAAAAASMLVLSLAILVMGRAAKNLSDVSPGQLAASSAAIVALLGSLLGAAKVISGISGKTIKNVLTMLAMAVAVKTLAKAVSAISDIPVSKMAAATASVSALVGVIGAMTRLAGKSKGAKVRSIFQMVGVALAVRLLGGAVEKLGGLDNQTLIKGVVSTSLILGALTIFSRFSNLKAGGFGNAVMFIAMAYSLNSIGQTISYLGSIDTETLVKGGIAAALIMGTMALMVQLSAGTSGMTTVLNGAAFILMAQSLLMVGQSISLLGAMDQEVLLQGGIAAGLILGALTTISLLMSTLADPTDMLAQAVLWISMAITMQSIASAISSLAEYPWEAIAVAVGALMVSMGGLALIASIAQGNIAGAAAILLLSAAVIALSVGLSILSGIGLEGVGVGLLALAGGLMVLIVAGFAAQAAAVGLLILTAAVLGMGIACLVAGAGVLMLGTGMSTLVSAMVSAGSVGWTTIVKLTAGLLAFAIAGLLAAPAALALGAGLLLLGTGLLMGGMGMQIMAAAIPAFVAAINQADQIGIIATAKLTAAIAAIGGAALIAAPGMALFAASLVLAGVGLLAFTAGGIAAMVVATLLGSVFANGINQANTAINQFSPSVATFATAAISMIAIAATLGTSVSTAFMSISTAIASCIPVVVASCVMFQTLGTTVVTNIVTGLQSATPQVTVAITLLASTIFTTFVSRMAIGQPMVYSGILALAAHIALAIYRVTSMVNSSISQLVSSMLAYLSNGLSNLASSVYSSATPVGYWMAEGIRRGFEGQRAALIEEARSAAAAMLAAAKAELQVNSPSKKFSKIGFWAAKGLEVGWTSTAVSAVKAVETTGEDFAEAFKDVVSSIDFDDISDDACVTITPVLDLSKIKRDSTDLKSILGDNPIGVVKDFSTGIVPERYSEKTTPNSGKTVVFNQYNTSPKALSEIEIYRQTRTSISRISRL